MRKVIGMVRLRTEPKVSKTIDLTDVAEKLVPFKPSRGAARRTVMKINPIETTATALAV
jgi:hypothetical protein